MTDRNMAQDPDCSIEDLEFLCRIYPEDVLNNPVLPLYALEQPARVKELARKCWHASYENAWKKLRYDVDDKAAVEFCKWVKSHPWAGRLTADLAPPHRMNDNEARAFVSRCMYCIMEDRAKAIDPHDKLSQMEMDWNCVLPLRIQAMTALGEIVGHPIRWPQTDLKPNRRRR